MSEGYFYVASPYERYVDGKEAAFREICRVTAALARAGVIGISPIAHWHSVEAHGGRLERHDRDFWLAVNRPLMDAAIGIIIAKMHGWKQSAGVQAELDYFAAAGKQILFIDPGVTILGGVSEELRRAA